MENKDESKKCPNCGEVLKIEVITLPNGDLDDAWCCPKCHYYEFIDPIAHC